MEKEKRSFLITTGEGSQVKFIRENENSRISIALLNAITSDRQPSLYDPMELIERDKHLRELEDKDQELNLIRNGKPFYLPPAETRLAYALSYGLCLNLEAEDIQEIINNPLSKREVVRKVDLATLSRYLNKGTSRDREVRELWRLFFRLDSIFNIQELEYTDKHGRIRKGRRIRPLIRIKDGVQEQDYNEEDENLNTIVVSFSRIFFQKIMKRFGILTLELLEDWDNELYGIVLSSILSVYWHYWKASKDMEKRLKFENSRLPKDKRLSLLELEAKIEREIEEKEVWNFELSFSTIKKRIATDYDSTRFLNFKFKKDLEKVICKLKTKNLITDKSYIDVKNKKAVFVLNKDYGGSQKDKQNFLESLQ